MCRLGISIVLLAAFFVSAPVLAESHPRGFVENDLNGSVAPITTDGVTTFTVREGECSETGYNNGTGENDCINGSVKSQLVAKDRAKLGQTVEYSFDVLVPTDFAYPGEYIAQSVPFRAEGWDSKLRLAGWEGPTPKSFVYLLKLDAKNGITFLGHRCQAPSDFGQWTRFSMKIRWANDEKGWVKVTCDDRLVYLDEGTSSTAQTQCYQANECAPGVVHDSQSFIHTVGLAVNGAGFEWKKMGLDSPFTDLPDSGITVQMRNIAIREGGELYDDAAKAQVAALQTALNGLGCDVGTADGIVGKRTREQAMLCRKLPEEGMPAKLTAATVGAFVDFYTDPEVADLPAGERPPDIRDGLLVPTRIVRAVVEQENGSSAMQVNSTIMGTVEGTKFKKFDVLLEGVYIAKTEQMMTLNITFTDDLGEKNTPDVRSCGGRLVVDSFGYHVKVDFSIEDGIYALPKGDCFAKLLPGKVGEKVNFVLSHFSDIAVGLVGDKTFIAHEGLKSFLGKVASGEIAIEN